MTVTVELARPPQEVFTALAQVTSWWSNDFEGSCGKLGGTFTIHHAGQHYSKQEVVELVPNKKMVWSVTDSNLHWLEKNKDEWTGTKMVFELEPEGNRTMLHFTHEGLVPAMECYAMCSIGWNMIIKEWLAHFINNGTPAPAMNRAADIRNQLLSEKNKTT